jgi:peptidoglycan/xylan/chitin deacetylase (PgdA/CDA1 family)
MRLNIILGITLLLISVFSPSVFSQDILLSFDVEPVDGRESVMAVLETLASHNATATFFVTGEYAEQYPEIVALMSGHEVGCHSYSHPHMTGLSKEEKEDQIRKCGVIEKITGVTPVGFRAPYNQVDFETTEVLAAEGYKYDASRLEGFQFGKTAIIEQKIDSLIFPFSDVISMYYLHVPKKLYYWLILHAGDSVSASFHPHIMMDSIDEFDKMLDEMNENDASFRRHDSLIHT